MLITPPHIFWRFPDHYHLRESISAVTSQLASETRSPLAFTHSPLVFSLSTTTLHLTDGIDHFRLLIAIALLCTLPLNKHLLQRTSTWFWSLLLKWCVLYLLSFRTKQGHSVIKSFVLISAALIAPSSTFEHFLELHCLMDLSPRPSGNDILLA